MIYLGRVKASSTAARDGAVSIEHRELGGVKAILPVLNVPGTFKPPAEEGLCLFCKCENEQGNQEYYYLGEAVRATEVSVTPEELEETESVTGFSVGNMPSKDDYDVAGILSKTRYGSPNNHHTVEMREKVNPAIDGKGPVQEQLGVLVKTLDGKFIDLNDGIQEGSNKVVIGLKRESPGVNSITLNGGKADAGPESLMMNANGNVEITSGGISGGSLTVALADGDGSFDVEHNGTGTLNIKGNATLNIESKEVINIKAPLVTINKAPQ